ncbi:MAG: hypothetical protein WDA70_02125 [Lysobacteraceae bacterium]
MNLPQLTSSQRLPALLMAVVTLWALLFAIAGMAGLGGRYRLHPDDPGRVPALPALDLSQARSPLQPLETYADIGERPLFNDDRRPLPPPEDEGAAAEEAPPPPAAPLDIAVTSIIMTPDVRIAIVTDNKTGASQSLRVGQTLEGEQSGWTLAELEPRKAVFSGPTGRSSVDLRVFNGSGAQAPSPAATAAAASGEEPGAAPAESQDAAADTSAGEPMTPESRAEMIRRRIEERRRQMREEAERANNR